MTSDSSRTASRSTDVLSPPSQLSALSPAKFARDRSPSPSWTCFESSAAPTTTAYSYPEISHDPLPEEAPTPKFRAPKVKVEVASTADTDSSDEEPRPVKPILLSKTGRPLRASRLGELDESEKESSSESSDSEDEWVPEPQSRARAPSSAAKKSHRPQPPARPTPNSGPRSVYIDIPTPPSIRPADWKVVLTPNQARTLSANVGPSEETDGRIPCPLIGCPDRFFTRQQLFTHLETVPHASSKRNPDIPKYQIWDWDSRTPIRHGLAYPTSVSFSEKLKPGSDGLFKCPVPECGEQFQQRDRLACHLRNRPIACDGCGRVFPRYDALHRHKRGACHGRTESKPYDKNARYRLSVPPKHRDSDEEGKPVASESKFLKSVNKVTFNKGLKKRRKK